MKMLDSCVCRQLHDTLNHHALLGVAMPCAPQPGVAAQMVEQLIGATLGHLSLISRFLVTTHHVPDGKKADCCGFRPLMPDCLFFEPKWPHILYSTNSLFFCDARLLHAVESVLLAM